MVSISPLDPDIYIYIYVAACIHAAVPPTLLSSTFIYISIPNSDHSHLHIFLFSTMFDLIHTFLNLTAPPFTFFSLLFLLPPFQLFKFFLSILGTLFSEDVAGKVVVITGASSGIGEVSPSPSKPNVLNYIYLFLLIRACLICIYRALHTSMLKEGLA